MRSTATALVLGFWLSGAPAQAADVIRLDTNITPLAYRLVLAIDPRTPDFSGVATIDLAIATATDRIVLHAGRLTLDSVELAAGSRTQTPKVETLADDGTIALLAGTALPAGPARLTIRYHAPFATGLEGLYHVHDNGADYAFTQFEAIGARRAFPAFDEPRFKAPFTVDLTVPEGMMAIANTPKQSVDAPQAGTVTYHFAPSPPLPTYLVAFAVGDFDVVNAAPIPPSDIRRQPIALRGIATKGKGSELRFALDATAPLLTRLEAWFGIAYPFEKLDLIAVPDFGAGGMENAGAITYDENIALLDEEATLHRQREFVSTHAHELAHQWFGDLATPRWWDDLWLNEAVATFMESKIAAAWKPDWRFDSDLQHSAEEAMELDLLPSVRRVREPVQTIGGISAAFDPITYQKGAALIAMAETAMGAEPFRAFLHAFLVHHAFGSIQSSDFIDEMKARAGGSDAARMVESYIHQQGVPRIAVTRNCLQRRPTLTLWQQRLRPLGISFKVSPAAPIWVAPVCLSTAGSFVSEGRCIVSDATTVHAEADIEFCQPGSVLARTRGYYALSMNAHERAALIGALRTLQRTQALEAGSDLDLGLAAGELTLGEYLAAAQALSTHADLTVRASPLERLKSLLGDAANEAQRNRLKSFVRARYRPQLDAIGLLTPLSGRDTASWQQQLYREQLVEFFADTRADPDLEVTLAALGRRIAADDASDLEGTELAPPEIVGPGLVSAARLGGTDFLNQALERLQEAETGHERSLWLDAIAASHAPSSGAAIERLVSAPTTKDQDVLALLFARANESPFRAETWALVERTLPMLLKRLDGDLDLSLVEIADGFCSDADAAAVEAVIRPVQDRIRGGAIQLAQTVDRIHACAALAAKVAGEPLLEAQAVP